MSAPTWATFLVAITVLTMTPGLDTMLVIRNSARGGWKDGMLSSLGICSGLFVHGTVSAVGISLLLLQTSWLFGLLKLLGAGYLVWLGVTSWRDALARRTPLMATAASLPAGRGFNALRSLREGLLSNVLNPKAVIFYMAFLPQFIDPAGSALRQSLMLASCHFAIAMVWQCLLVLLVGRVQGWLQRPRVYRVFGGVTGSVMVLLGLSLAVER